MELSTWSVNNIKRPDVEVAKNYLDEKGVDVLHKIVPAYLDIAGRYALNREPMYMIDWLETIDGYHKMSWQDILTTRRRISMNTNNSRIRLEELKELYDIGKKVSLITENKRATTLRAAEAEKIVEKVLLHCNSIIKLFCIGLNDYTELDFALIASAARNIMDCGNVYFYISERGISEEEVNFRYNLQLLNYDKNIKDIFQKFGFRLDSFKMRLIDFGFVKEEIKNSSIYLKASNNEKSMILSGKHFFKRKRIGIFSQDLESAIFNMLSNSVHSFYIGLSNNSIKTPGVFASYIDSLMLCIVSIETALIYTANILNDYLLLRRQLSRKVTKEERDKIKRLMSTEYLNDYLDNQKSEFDKENFKSENW